MSESSLSPNNCAVHARHTCRLDGMTTESSSQSSGGVEVKNVAPAVVAPVVATKTGVTLAEHLDLKNLPLAATPGGKNFVMKALHPSDFTIKTNRGPGGTVPSLAVANDIIQTIDVPATATRAVVMQTANINILGSIVFYDGSGAVVDHWCVVSNTLGAGSFQQGPFTGVTAPSFADRTIIEDYRVTSQSITMESIVPVLYEAGTITSAQVVAKPQTCSLYEYTKASTDIATVTNHGDLWLYPFPPDADVLLMGTNAFTSKIQEGFYQPLKLSKFKFVQLNDTHIPVTRQTNAIGLNEGTATAARCFFPYYLDVLPRASNWGIPKPSSNIVGLTYLSINQPTSGVAKLRFRFRQVVEIHPRVGARYAALAEAPLPPDELAYKMYCEISQRMRDAYPARYNDENKLKGVINALGKGLIDYVEPAVALLSTFLPQLKPVSVAVTAGSRMLKNVMSPRKYNQVFGEDLDGAPILVTKAGAGGKGIAKSVVDAVQMAQALRKGGRRKNSKKKPN